MSGPLLVTGGSGYLGRELLRLRPDAVAVARTSGFRLDVRDADGVDDVFAALRPGFVIHTAYRQDDRETTLDGARNIARAAAAVPSRLVHLSSDLVFDGARDEPYTEDDEPCPITDYGRAKADAEAAVLRAHPDALVVRTSLMYGGAEPGPQERLAADPDAVLFTDEIRSPVHVGDLARALLELLSGERRGVLHCAGADAVSRFELAQLLAPSPAEVRAGTLAGSGLVRPRNCSLSSSLAASLLDTPLRGVREVLAGSRSGP